MLEVKKSKLVAILVDLGHKAAGSWPLAKLGKKAEEVIPEAAEENNGKSVNDKRKITFKKLVQGDQQKCRVDHCRRGSLSGPGEEHEEVVERPQGRRREWQGQRGRGTDRSRVQAVFDLLSQARHRSRSPCTLRPR